MRHIIWKTVFVMAAGLSAAFYYLYYTQYFKWRDCFNDLGRCYDSESGIVYLEQAGIMWISLAVLMSVIAVFLLWRLKR